MTTHAMIDLETLDVTPQAQVLTIGGVKFNPNTLHEPFDEFYFRLEINDQDEMGRTASESTLKWWGEQDDSIIMEAFGDHDRVKPLFMLEQLKKWYVGCDAVWAQGVGFDIVMIEDLCRMYKVPVPWSFWQVKDSRTLLGMMPSDPRKQFKFDAHNALEDARIQAKCVQLAYKHFDIKR